MNAPRTPTGTVTDGPYGRELQIIRRFQAPIEDVWAAVTESPRLQRWLGRWEGDPSTGKVRFLATAEGEDVPAQDVEITECQPPYVLGVLLEESTADGPEHWRIRLELSHDAGVTTLLFAQAIVDQLASVGPGWEYYLDRLATAIDGRDPGVIVWDDYYPSMSSHYAAFVTS